MRKKIMCVLLCALLAVVPLASASAAETAGEQCSDEKVTVSAFAGNSFSTASNISIGTTYSGTLSSSNTKDYYKFTLSESGTFKVHIASYATWIQIHIYDESGDLISNSYTTYYGDPSVDYFESTASFELTAGTYRVCIERGNDSGNYSFYYSFDSANESFAESDGGSNNSMSDADKIALNTKYIGQIALNDEIDYYKFSLSKAKTINLKTTVYSTNATNFIIYDSTGTNALFKKSLYANSTTGTATHSNSVSLSAGTYYLAVNMHYSTGNYKFSLTTASSKSLSRVKITNVKKSGKKIKISWKKVNNAAKYQIQYRKKGSKKWTKVTTKSTSKTLKNLTSGKKYQVRVRAVKNGKKGKWSKIKTVKVK